MNIKVTLNPFLLTSNRPDGQAGSWGVRVSFLYEDRDPQIIEMCGHKSAEDALQAGQAFVSEAIRIFKEDHPGLTFEGPTAERNGFSRRSDDPPPPDCSYQEN